MRGGLEPSWNNDVGIASLNPVPVFPELYYPLWWYSGSYAVYSGAQTTAGLWFLQKGSTSISTTVGIIDTLFTLNSSASSLTTYALEASFKGSGSTANLAVWDLTSNTLVANSTITTASSTLTVFRSNTFTLTAGHSYGVTSWTTSGSGAQITDASLIIFPPTPLTSPSVSSISLANPSGNTLKEAYIPLWVYSSGTVSTTATGSITVALAKGQSTTVGASSGTARILHTLSSSWPVSQSFVFEASLYSSSSSYTAYASLYDITTSTVACTVSTSSTTATLIRSPKVTLTPGHEYGVSPWQSGSGTCYITKAHLVALAP